LFAISEYPNYLYKAGVKVTDGQNNHSSNDPDKNDLTSEQGRIDDATDETVEGPKQTNDTLQVENIPEHAIIFRQSHLSWLMPSAIWIIGLVIVDLQIGLLGGLGILLAPLIAAPRYLRWRQTVYHLSEDSLYLTMAGLPIIQKSKIYRVKFDTMMEMGVRHGFFGRTLGYGEVNIIFDDKRVARLSYISDYQSFMDHINSNTDLPGAPAEEDSN